jgi:hypothetical protein
MWRKACKFADYFLLGLSLLSILIALYWLYIDVAPMLDSLGETNGSDCDTRGDFHPVPNGAGMVATGHSTGCAVVLLTTEFTTYVYVHKTGESDSAKSLVFRFDVSPDASEDPKLVWDDASNLHISVPEVAAVTKQLTSINGVKISYSVGKIDYSLEEVERDVENDAALWSFWLIFWAGVWIRYLKRSVARVTLAEVLAISAIWIGFVFSRFLPVMRILFK